MQGCGSDEAPQTVPNNILAQLHQQGYLKASITGAGDWFGATVALADNTLVVGARLEDSAATGINGEPSR
jgi:hypothetical protein